MELDRDRFATLAKAAAKAGMKSSDAQREAEAYGWPDRADIAAAAAQIRASLAPGDTVPTTEPSPLAEVTEQALAAIKASTSAGTERFGLSRAKLSMPIYSGEDVDGNRWTLIEGIVDVEIHPGLLLQALDGADVCPVTVLSSRQLTAAGREVCALLTALAEAGVE